MLYVLFEDLRAEGFFCNLGVLYRGLGIGKLYFFSAVNFFQFWSSKPWIRMESGSVSNENGSKALVAILLLSH
jgi:hypothetical protein